MCPFPYLNDADGHLIRAAAQTGTQWLVSCRTYTASGKLLKAWGPALTAADTSCPAAVAPVSVTDYAYDIHDRPILQTENLTALEGGNRVTETVYNLDDSVQIVKRGVGSRLAQNYASYTYTVNGLPATVKDAKNNLTTYVYDGHDRKLQTRYPDKVTAGLSSTTDYEQYSYDNNSNLISLRKRNGQSITLAYDNLNRLLSRSYPVVADNVSFGYDLLGRRTAANYASYAIYYTWDNAGRLTATGAGGKTLSHQYDAAGNRIRTTWPEVTPFYVTRTYDALNRPTSIKELGVTNLASYAYDDLSRRTTVTLGNGTATAYGYSAQSTQASLVHNLTGTAQDITWSYARNQAQEINSHSWSNDSYQWTGYTNGTRSYTANGLNQHTTAAGATLAYDANGNLGGDGVWTYGYDLDNRLKSASKTGLAATLAYDAEGRLRQTTLAGVITNLLYDGTDLLAEYDSAGTLLRRYVHGPGVDEPLVWYEGAVTTNKSWLYADHLGSIVATANATGTATSTLKYGPYGEPNQTTGVRFRYTGQQLIGPLNLYYYKARFYSPALGRFLQTDPIGYGDDLNLYAYVGNNPLNRKDPSGLAADGAGSASGGANPFASTFTGQQVQVAAGGTRTGLPPSPMRAIESLRIEQLNDQIRAIDPNFKQPTAIGTPGGTRAGEVQYLEGVLGRAGGTTYLYQKLSAEGEHLKYGITNNLGTRYTQEQLAGGSLKQLANGSRKEMLQLERNLHETLPIGREEAQKFYIQKQIDKGLKPPPYNP